MQDDKVKVNGWNVVLTKGTESDGGILARN